MQIDWQIHTKTSFQPIKLQESWSGPRINRTLYNNDLYCLTACLYAKCWNMIGWIMERGPLIHFHIDGPYHLYGFRSKLKHRIFGKMAQKLSNFPERPEMIDYYIFGRVFHQFTFSANSRACSEYFSQAINSLITDWTVNTKNINPSVLRIDLPAVGLYVRPRALYFSV